MNERDRLAEKHLGMVHALCKRFAGKGVEYEELYAAGCLGLAKALDRFDESRGLQFSTYAFPVIAGEIKQLFRDGGAVRVSRSLRALAVKIQQISGAYERQHGREPTVRQIAELLGVSPEKIAEAVGSTRAPLSLTADGDGESSAQLDLPAPDMQDAVTDRLSLQAAIGALDGDDRRLIRLRYYQGKTQTETARLLGATQVQICRREKKILARLRRAFS